MDEKEISQVYERNFDMLYRLCFSYLKNKEDALDAVQSVFYQVIRKRVVFENREHEKAWLIVSSSNICKNMLKHWWRKNVSIEERDVLALGKKEEDKELLLTILNMPEKIRISMYLYYYEGYSSVEISKMIGKSDGTIRGYLAVGRELLKKEMR